MFEILIQEMKLRNFSPKTRKVYLSYNFRFLEWIRKSPRDISGEDIRQYLLYLISRQYSSSTINLAHNALAFYYGTILRKNISAIPFQKREQKVREIASPDEIRKMISTVANPKHKILIGLLYASGIRRSEAIKIQLRDIDCERKLLLVRQGKGAKFRYTILSEQILTQIKEYLQTRSTISSYLFSTKEGHITDRTVEAVIDNARQKANIPKNITPHSLRHSFATHLMAQGTNIEYIQQMLGHKDIRTTKIYEHIVPAHLQKIPNPHDKL